MTPGKGNKTGRSLFFGAMFGLLVFIAAEFAKEAVKDSYPEVKARFCSLYLFPWCKVIVAEQPEPPKPPERIEQPKPTESQEPKRQPEPLKPPLAKKALPPPPVLTAPPRAAAIYVGSLNPGNIWGPTRLIIGNNVAAELLVGGDYSVTEPRVDARVWPHPNGMAVGSFYRGEIVRILDVCSYPARNNPQVQWVWALAVAINKIATIEFEPNKDFENCNHVGHWDDVTEPPKR
jgi:hypothetical protein